MTVCIDPDDAITIRTIVDSPEEVVNHRPRKRYGSTQDVLGGRRVGRFEARARAGLEDDLHGHERWSRGSRTGVEYSRRYLRGDLSGELRAHLRIEDRFEHVFTRRSDAVPRFDHDVKVTRSQRRAGADRQLQGVAGLQLQRERGWHVS